MLNQILPALRMKLFLTLLLGVIYPLSITAISQFIFPSEANGSLVTSGNKIVGSRLIGQSFTRPGYFHPRPSMAGNDGYDATSSGGSNLGSTSRKLHDRVQASVISFRKENPDFQGPIPADLLTTSASGLDPHISPDSALAQAARVAKARGVSAGQIRQFIDRHTESPDFGVLGEPRLNVLMLNLDLDSKLPPVR